MFELLIQLLAEFGAPEETVELAQRFAAHAGDEEAPESVEALSDEELDELLGSLMGLADDEEASVALLAEAADAAEAIRDEQESRIEAREAEEAALAEQRARLRGEADDAEADAEAADGAEAEGDDDAEASEDEGSEEEPAEEADASEESPALEGADDDEREPVAASSRPAARRRIAARRPRSAEPRPSDDRRAARMTLAADVPGFQPGSRIEDPRDLDRALIARAETFRRSRPSGDGAREYLTVASIHPSYPEERQLSDDPVRNARLVRQTLEAGLAPEALTASGGLCAPLDPYYTVPVLGGSARPVRDALVGFQTSRGGVTGIAPPVLSDLDGASVVWTAANDASPSDPATKPCVTVACGATRETEIDAVTLCLQFGNFRARTFAEFDAAITELSLVQHARVAEQQILTRIEALSDALNNEETVVSAYRDWLALLVQAAATYRARVRDDNLVFRAIAPSQAPAIFAIDHIRGMPAGMGFDEAYRRTASDIATDLAAHGINVTWSPDMNVPGAQAAATDLADLPPSIDTAFYPEGTFLFLDGGRLDLGVVRDSTLNGTNDFQTFVETFEAVHQIGHQSLWLSANVCPSGAQNGTLDPAALCASYT